jgi:hypothetical protein
VTKPKVTFTTTYTGLGLRWLGTKIVDPKILIPGGILVDAASVTADGTGKKPVVSGAVLVRNEADRAAKLGYKLATAAAVDATYLASPGLHMTILIHDLPDVLDDPYGAGIQPNAGNIIYIGGVNDNDFLPNWTSYSAMLKDLIRKAYLVITAQK